MSSVLKKARGTSVATPTPVPSVHTCTWISHWELYPILLVAAFLRLYHIETTQFDADQADIFQMAHSAVSHAHLVATSNVASIHIFNPPGIIYFLMIAAAFSANPLAGALLTAILSILSVLLTYVVICRYYGRLTATIAASFYAPAAAPIFYSRFMWNQNLLLFFVPLFISVLLYGVIERRKGWFAPAVLLVGLLAQLHGSGFLLAAPLAVAFVLSPGTIRVRDIVFGLLGLLLLYSTYALWLVHSHFRDVPIFLNSTRGPSIIDNQALIFFQQFLSPYGFDPNNIPLTNPRSFLFRLSPLLSIMTVLMVVLVACSAIIALVLALRRSGPHEPGPDTPEPDKSRKGGIFLAWRTGMRWWRELRAAPYRCAFLVLLSWQLVPLVYLLRHSIKLFAHYFIMLMPGPFILLAIFLIHIVAWTKPLAAWGRGVRFGIYGLTILLIAGQFLGGLALVLDTARGTFNADYNRFNALSSLQHAFGEADRLAQSRHLRHVYVSTDDIRRAASYYLAEQMRTPTTVFDDSCAVLPGVAAGPAVLLTSPNSDLTAAMIARFAMITLIDQPARLGGAPFRLYLVEPLPLQAAQYETLAQDVQFLGAKNSARLTVQQGSQLVTRWAFLHTKLPASNTTYTYRFKSGLGPQQNSSQCVLTAIQPGDQLLVPFTLSAPQPGPMNMQVQTFMTRPDTLTIHLPSLFALNFDTYNRVDTPHTTLQATDGRKTISVASP